MAEKAKHIAFFLSSLSGGGAERVFVDLARVLSKRGHCVDLVLTHVKGPLVPDVVDSVRTVALKVPSTITFLPSLMRLPRETRKVLLSIVFGKLPRVVRSLPALATYLREERPDALLVTTNTVNFVGLWAAWLAKAQTRLIVREACTLSMVASRASKTFEQSWPQLAKQWYPHADGIITVSDGVADDLAQVTGLSRERMTTIYNPVDTQRVSKMATEPLDDPWFLPGQPPLLLAAGRLVPQKDYPTLFRAFARIRANRPIRLMILGEGPERSNLQSLANELNIAEDIRMSGYATNPYAYMARASAFVLSSGWEGFPNVLLEALACGCPVISTDCPSGPAELLGHGAYGRLVPVGDHVSLAEGILSTLDASPDSERLKERATMFSIDAIADLYLGVLLKERQGFHQNLGI